MHVLGISGSLRLGSYNTRLLRAAASALPPDTKLVTFEQLAAVPPYSEDLDGDGSPPGVNALRTAIARADAVLIATPEYNSSVPGQLKNALDWASRPYSTNVLRAKPATVIGASTGIFGAVWAQAEVRKVLVAIGAHTLEDEVAVGEAHHAFASDGSLHDPRLRALLADAIGTLVQTARTRGEQLAADPLVGSSQTPSGDPLA